MDIILEGFLEAEKVHGVRYTRFIGYGDSFVHTIFLQSVLGDLRLKSWNVLTMFASAIEEHWRR